MAVSSIILPKLNPIQLNEDGVDSWFYETIPFFEVNKKYCQKFQKADKLTFQFITLNANYVSAEAVIIDELQQEILAITISDLNTTYDADYTTHHIEQALSSLNDNQIYFVKLTIHITDPEARAVVYYSEPLHIRTTWSNTLKLEYTHDENDFNVIFYDDTFLPVGTSFTFIIRVEGGLRSEGYAPQSKDNIYRNDRADMTTVHSTPFTSKRFSFGDSYGIPNWLADKINRVFSCYYSQINGVYYNKIENAKFEPIRSEHYPLAGWTLELVEDEDMNSFNYFPFPDGGRIYWLYRGVVTDPTTDPGTPTEDVYYAAPTVGTYTNFGGLEVLEGEVAFLRYDTSTLNWYKDVIAEVTPTASIEVGSAEYTLRSGESNTIDPSYAGLTKPVFMYMVFEKDGTDLIPQPGIQMSWDGANWTIFAEENITLVIKFIGYEEI